MMLRLEIFFICTLLISFDFCCLLLLTLLFFADAAVCWRLPFPLTVVPTTTEFRSKSKKERRNF